MSGTVVGTPNSPPSVDADWSKVINNYVVGGKGQNGISLTEWAVANTTKPTIASGSSIEVNGSFVTFTATTIGDDGSLVTGTIYLYIDITTTPGTALPKFTNTAPVWDDAKGGFYRSGDRYTGHQMEWDGASAYTEKLRFCNFKSEEKHLVEMGFGLRVKYLTLTGNGSDMSIVHGISNLLNRYASAQVSILTNSGTTWLDSITYGSEYSATNVKIFSTLPSYKYLIEIRYFEDPNDQP